MRIKERIPIILDIFFNDPLILQQFIELELYETMELYSNWKKIKEEWLEEPDLRFGQLLVNMNLIPYMSKCWFYEEDDWLIEKGYLKLEDIKFWGRNYDENNNKLPKTEFILLKNLTTEHIKNIIAYFGGRGKFKAKSPRYYEYFKERLKKSIV